VRVRRFLIVVAAVLSAANQPSSAQEVWPTKPIRLIAPVAPGIGSDRYARLLAQKLTVALKQPVIVENRPGAGGNIGADLVAKAPQDGYTLLWGHNALFGTAPHVLRSAPFDVLKDFVPVAGNAVSYPYLYASKSFPVESFSDLVRLARQRPGALNYGSLGIASGPHVAMEWLKHEARIDLTHVPYKGGSAEILRALAAGEIVVGFDYYMPLMAQVKSGRIKVLGVASLARNPAAPEIPTLHEQGLTGFEYFGWSGVFAPARTPKPIVDKLNAEIGKARASPEMQKLIRDAGSTELKGSPEEFAAFVRAEYERGARLVKLSGATLE